MTIEVALFLVSIAINVALATSYATTVKVKLDHVEKLTEEHVRTCGIDKGKIVDAVGVLGERISKMEGVIIKKGGV